MKAIVLIILCLLFFANCGSESNAFIEDLSPKFKLEKDIRNFEEKLKENETLTLLFNLSACTSNRKAKLDFIKQSSQIHFYSEISDDVFDTNKLNTFYPLENFDLDSIFYNQLISDLYLIDEPLKNYNRMSADIILVHEHDSIILEDTLGLTSKLKFIDRFNSIMLREFPNTEIFKSLDVPKPNK